MMDEPNTSLPQPPRIVQGSVAPVFRASGDAPLTCKGCGHVLVEGYNPRLLAAVTIECFRCGGATSTPQWPDGEPLPAGLVSLGDRGRYRLAGTVDMRDRPIVVASEQEIARANALSGIQPPPRGGLEISLDGLKALEATLALLFKDFPAEMKRVAQAALRGNQLFLRCPPAWALTRIKASVAAGQVDLSSPDGPALATLHNLMGLLPRWRRHERFPAMCAAMLSEFNHSMAQLTIASYLADHGNRIGFSEPLVGGGRSPDLFINLDALARHSVEIKAPDELQWPASTPNADRLKRLVERKMREARGQITQACGGVLTLGASIADVEFMPTIQRVLDGMAAAGGMSTRLSAIAVINRALQPDVQVTPNGLNLTTSSQISVVVNPDYSGPGKLATG